MRICMCLYMRHEHGELQTLLATSWKEEYCSLSFLMEALNHFFSVEATWGVDGGKGGRNRNCWGGGWKRPWCWKSVMSMLDLDTLAMSGKDQRPTAAWLKANCSHYWVQSCLAQFACKNRFDFDSYTRVCVFSFKRLPRLMCIGIWAEWKLPQLFKGQRTRKEFEALC